MDTVAAIGTKIDREIVLFDGVCNFCNGTINFVLKRDKKDSFVFTPLQSGPGQEVLKKHNLPLSEFESFILVSEDKVYQRSSAALRIARKLSGGWPLFYVFMILPKPVRDFFYNIIARNRYRWWGKRDECMIPTPELRNKFLD